MSSIDRKRLARLYAAVAAWPWPNRSRTLTGSDVSEFFFTMDTVQKRMLAAIAGIARCDDSNENPDDDLARLEILLGLSADENSAREPTS